MHTNRLEERLTDTLDRRRPAKPVAQAEAIQSALAVLEETEQDRYLARRPALLDFISNLKHEVFANSMWGSSRMVVDCADLESTVVYLEFVMESLNDVRVELAYYTRIQAEDAAREAAEREEAEDLAYRLPPVETPCSFGNELMRVDGRRGQFSRRQAKKAKVAKHAATKRQLDKLSFAANAPKLEIKAK